jgi:riboflavin biosynthesis pyrimidine reductase
MITTPPRPRPAPIDDTWAIEPLLTAGPPTPPVRGGRLPDELGSRLGGDFAVPLRPTGATLVVNFVSTLDGVVAFDRRGLTGGRQVSGGFEPDRFLMGALRAAADAVVVGAGTQRAGNGRGWSPRDVHPASAEAFAEWRRSMGLAPEPTAVIVTASGRIDPDHPGLHDRAVPALIVTTTSGARALPRLPAGCEVTVAGDGDGVTGRALVDALEARSHRLVLCEGGPGLFGSLLRDGVVDELYLTVAPQIAGRAGEADRLALVEGVAYSPGDAPWARLRDVRRVADHLFLHYHIGAIGGAS